MLDPRTISFEPSFMHSCMIRKLASGELVAIVGGRDTYLLSDPDLEPALLALAEELRYASRIQQELAARPKVLKRNLDDLEPDP